MNNTEKDKIQNEIQRGFLIKALERNLSHDEEDEITEICQHLGTHPNAEFDITNFSLNAICVLNQEIRSRFPNLKCTYDKINAKFNVKNEDFEDDDDMEDDDEDKEEEEEESESEDEPVNEKKMDSGNYDMGLTSQSMRRKR